MEMKNPLFITFEKSSFTYKYASVIVVKRHTDVESKNLFDLLSSEILNEEYVEMMKETYTLIEAVPDFVIQLKKNNLSKTTKSKYVQHMNHNNIELGEKVNVFPMLEINECVCKKMMDVFRPNTSEYIELFNIFNHFSIPTVSISYKLLSSLKNLSGLMFWMDINNINVKYINKFSCSIIPEKNTSVTKMKENDDYDFDDKNVEKKQVKNNETYIKHYFNRNENFITEEDVKMFISSEKKNKLLIICFLLANKDTCHVLLHCPYVLDIINECCTKNFQKKKAIKYGLSYGWYSLCLDEECSRGFVKDDSPLVFTLENAKKLPLFSFDAVKPYKNPYWSRQYNNSNEQYLLPVNKISEDGIVSIDKFRKRLNIFTSNKMYPAMYDGINWNNMALTGGMMAAIMPKHNSLKKRYRDDKTNSFYNDYYKNSDIDVICKHKTTKEFLEHISDVIRTMQKNCNGHEYEMECVSKISMRVNEEKEDESEFDEEDIKKEIYEKYSSLKKNFFDKYNGEIDMLDSILHIIREPIDIKNVKEITHYKTDTINPDLWSYVIQGENGKEYVVKEIYRFRVKFRNQVRPFEFFKINNDSFMSAISRFHLPPVRSYYNGTTVFMLPSAISAYMTLSCIGVYKNENFIKFNEIICKYHMRGYGFYFDNYKKKYIIKEALKIDSLKKNYNIIKDCNCYDHIEYSDPFYDLSLQTKNSIIARKKKTYRSIRSMLESDEDGYGSIINKDIFVVKSNFTIFAKYEKMTPFLPYIPEAILSVKK